MIVACHTPNMRTLGKLWQEICGNIVMEEDDSFSVPEVYEVCYGRSLDKQEQKLVIQHFWMKF
jgi:hypothetical protein